jgi:hypothetical protein
MTEQMNPEPNDMQDVDGHMMEMPMDAMAMDEDDDVAGHMMMTKPDDQGRMD